MENKILFYRGVVEDNIDPEKNGRVKVRIYGIHTEHNENSGEKFEFVKTSDLPWAEVNLETNIGLISGVGLSSVLRKGTWVRVFLENDDPNTPIIIGVISGINSEDSKGKYSGGKGFHDPDEVYPYPERSTESDFNRLCRVEKISETIHQTINDSVDIVSSVDGVSGANVSQTEPNSTNDASLYPHVKVLETASGHVIELDDSVGNERIRVYHRTGSYIEVKPDGSFIQKSVGELNHYIHIGDVDEHIAKGVKKYIEENLEEIVGGNFLKNVKGNLELHVEGNLHWVVDGTTTINSGGNYLVTAPRIDLNL